MEAKSLSGSYHMYLPIFQCGYIEFGYITIQYLHYYKHIDDVDSCAI